MDEWPPIAEPELRERLGLPDERFPAFLTDLVASIPPRAPGEQQYRYALAYPWARPASSFVLDGEAVTPLAAVPAEEMAQLRTGRWPLLAFGSNGAPERLALKLGHLPADDRRLLAVAGDLHGYDVGASAHPSYYGALPATLVPSPGTAVRASVLWVSAAQLTALTWTELSYALGRLGGVRFVPDEAGEPGEGLLAFVSRLGAHRVDGELVVLDAVAARGRVHRPWTQADLLDDVALRAYGPGTTGRDLVDRVMADFGGVSATVGPALRSTALPFGSPDWTPYPAAERHPA